MANAAVRGLTEDELFSFKACKVLGRFGSTSSKCSLSWKRNAWKFAGSFAVRKLY